MVIQWRSRGGPWRKGRVALRISRAKVHARHARTKRRSLPLSDGSAARFRPWLKRWSGLGGSAGPGGGPAGGAPAMGGQSMAAEGENSRLVACVGVRLGLLVLHGPVRLVYDGRNRDIGPDEPLFMYYELMDPCDHDMVKWRHRGVRDPEIEHVGPLGSLGLNGAGDDLADFIPTDGEDL
ncbi:oligopeptide transporter 3-like [Dorcoceras hygrometricum]|uniref:Oligopeptide transporter 3-like n=1 Tax=Dorcoceras hygrometricum TaxID=472368 RepID=A0A2Z7DBP6_9LAMI|nr:oligopeptide transporter 3-like [Dorcoceras hygrometricum]